MQKIITAGENTVDKVNREALVNLVVARADVTRPEA